MIDKSLTTGSQTIVYDYQPDFRIDKGIYMDKMGKTFDKIHIRVIGSFEDADKIPGWMKANGGKYHRSFNSQVTHLVASEEAYLQNGEDGGPSSLMLSEQC